MDSMLPSLTSSTQRGSLILHSTLSSSSPFLLPLLLVSLLLMILQRHLEGNTCLASSSHWQHQQPTPSTSLWWSSPFTRSSSAEHFQQFLTCRYTALVSTVGAIIGLFASGEWRELKKDMEGFNQGRLSYVMTLVWTSICWQVTNVGLVGLIFEVSSLFSNVISSLAVLIAPVFAVILFHDTINGIKVMSLLCPLLQYSIVFD
ncbi:Purine permease plant protein [Dioscorea alata]|uniref:Purine permease plant protein n=1 Tax=Dioscorea alata TaxID=55571 RepID=A0ACB7UY86_DIOAL|nr:Purine permease plant protein [Dioscorea alata]